MVHPVQFRDGPWLLDWQAIDSIVNTYYRCRLENALKVKEDIDQYVVRQAPETFIERAFRTSVTVFSSDRKTWIASVPHDEARRRAAVSSDAYIRRLRDWVREPGAQGECLRERLAEISMAAVGEARQVENFRHAIDAENQAGMNRDIAKYRTAETLAKGTRNVAFAVKGAMLAAYVVPATAGGLVTTTLARRAIESSFSLTLDALTGELAHEGKRDARIVKVTGAISIDALKAYAAASSKNRIIIRVCDLGAKTGLETLAGVIEGQSAETAFRDAMLKVGLGQLAENMLAMQEVKPLLQRFAVRVAGDSTFNGNWRRDAGVALASVKTAAKKIGEEVGESVSRPCPVDSIQSSSIDFMSRALNMAKVDAAIRRAA